MEIMKWVNQFASILALFCIVYFYNVSAQDFDQFRRQNSDLSEFLKLLQTNQYMMGSFNFKSGTLFAPTDQAIRDYTITYKQPFTNSTLLYHCANVARSTSELQEEESISSELPANPVIWATKKHNSLYLNDAKVIRGNLKMKTGRDEMPQTQTVHVIDRVLEPTSPEGRESHLDNPTARKFLENSAKYGLASDQLTTKFAGQVKRTNGNDRMGLLDTIGKRTFFIPVDEAFKLNNNIRSVDSRTIDGHIIPDRAVFLRTADVGQRMETYKTSDAASNFPVFISFGKEFIDGKEVWIVKSDNREGDKDHLKGVVQAQIVRANIPVKNGVVHLISKPLVIIDTSVYQTLRLYGTEQIGSMKGFLNLVETRGFQTDLRTLLDGTNQNAHKITLLVPTNKAIVLSTELNSVKENTNALEQLLRLHILAEPISKEKIIEGSKNGLKNPFQVSSMAADHKKILFNVIGAEGNRTLFVEGGGVNATITQADIGATNGFIHMIDKVLGIPNHNFEEKLRSHPLLQTTYKLWVKERFDEKLNQSMEPLTFFAPSEKAWLNLRFLNDRAFTNIMEGSIGAIPTQLLERHLIVKKDKTIQELAHDSKNHVSFSVPIPGANNATDVHVDYPLESLNARLRVIENITTSQRQNDESHKKEEPQYYVQWKHMSVHVIRANIKCTNGIIHIIDTVLIDDGEVTVAGSPSQNPGQIFAFICSIVVVAFFM